MESDFIVQACFLLEFDIENIHSELTGMYTALLNVLISMLSSRKVSIGIVSK